MFVSIHSMILVASAALGPFAAPGDAGCPGCGTPDPCTVWECIDGECIHTDMGGLPCAVDADCIGPEIVCLDGQCVCNRTFLDDAGGGGSLQPLSGETSITMLPGETRRIEAWVQVLVATGDPAPVMASYSLLWPIDATPLPGATGLVSYVDNDPDSANGGSLLIDTLRADWLFADSLAVTVPVYGETGTPEHPIVGLIYNTAIPLDDVAPFELPQPRYLAEFEIEASADACGSHRLAFNANANDNFPPFSIFFGPGGANWYIDFDSVVVEVICPQPCTDIPEECADQDPCTIDQCVDGFCEHEDIAGQSCANDFECLGNGVINAGCVDNVCSCTQGTRAFMDIPGHGGVGQPSTGNTSIVMGPGTSRTIDVYLADAIPNRDISSYQLGWHKLAEAQHGAAGSVQYVDNNPGQPDGDSIVIDTTRPDWLYADTIAITTPTYNEEFEESVLVNYNVALPVDNRAPSTLPHQPVYVAQFDVVASADACGDHLFRWRSAANNDPHPIAGFFIFASDFDTTMEYQDVIVHVVCECESYVDCADVDDDGLRDDICTWWECVDNTCLATPIGFADMGGQFGDCRVDGATDGNDFFQALNCFANQDIDGNPGVYPCEPHPAYPPNTINVDGSGQFGSCVPDGVCDGNDARSALDTFNGFQLCSCPADGGGPAPTIDRPVEIVDRTGLTLVPSRRRMRAGTTVAVDVVVDKPLEDLQGYQLHVAATGGRQGSLRLVDISVEPHRNAVFEDLTTWDAFNINTQQMVVGLNEAGIHSRAHGYLATFTFAASKDAAGTFIVDLLHDDTDPSQRTFLFPTGPRAQIAIDKTAAAVIEVLGSRSR